jgi:hypothetical protein
VKYTLNRLPSIPEIDKLLAGMVGACAKTPVEKEVNKYKIAIN